jgi:membrane protein DedA with SNARE-associated domain
VEHIANSIIAFMGQVPAPLIYVIAGVWLGLESAGIGLPIEPMLLFVGSLAAQGAQTGINPLLAVLATCVGCLVFSSVAYWIGKRAGTTAISRVGRYVGLTQARADHIELWLRHRGFLGVLIVRETPMLRTYGSFVMGAADVPLPAFLLGTLTGALVYCGAFIALGAKLGENYRVPLRYLDQFGEPGIVALLIIAVVLLVLHHFWGRLSLRRLARHFHLHHHLQHVPATVEAI